MSDGRRRPSRSDLLVAIGAPLLGVIAITLGISNGDWVTLAFGAVALLAGLAFAVPLARGRRRPPQ